MSGRRVLGDKGEKGVGPREPIALLVRGAEQTPDEAIDLPRPWQDGEKRHADWRSGAQFLRAPLEVGRESARLANVGGQAGRHITRNTGNL